MNWSDRGLVIGARGHGEAAVVLDLLTREHGRHLGLVHGGRSRRLRPVLQPGNEVAANWRARLEEQLGTFVVEAETLWAARLMTSSLALCGLATLTAHLRHLPERDPHPALFDRAVALVAVLDDPLVAPSALVRFELDLLAELGFGLDLETCAVTGGRDDLAYVSPRTGRAVGREAGAPYRERLLALPALLTSAGPAGPDDLAAAFRLTGHFLASQLYEPRGGAVPDERARFVGLAGGRRAAGAPSDMLSPATPADSRRDGTR